MDYGNYSAVEWMCKDYNGNVIVYDEWSDIKSVRSKKIATLKEFIEARKLQSVRIEADTNMWIPDSFDAAYTSDPATDFSTAGISLVKVNKNLSRAVANRGYRIACNDAVRDYLHWEQAENGVVAVRPRLLIYERCKKLTETLPLLLVDDNDQEDIADQQDLDTWYDAFKMGFMTLYQPLKQAPDEETYADMTEFINKQGDKRLSQPKRKVQTA